MTELFVLQLSNPSDSIDFVSASNGNFRLVNGGFNISTPEVKREFYQYLPDTNAPNQVTYGTRKADIEFNVSGATRSAVIQNINRLQRLLRAADARVRTGSGQRCELAYAWEGANKKTYFEVIGGDVALPEDIMSVEKMHYIDRDDLYVVPNIKVSLTLNGLGYGVALESTALLQMPLSNTSATRTLDWITVTNPWRGHEEWVAIDKDDLEGDGPAITQFHYKDISQTSLTLLFSGIQFPPFPTKTVMGVDEVLQQNSPWVYYGPTASGTRNGYDLAALAGAAMDNKYYFGAFGEYYANPGNCTDPSNNCVFVQANSTLAFKGNDMQGLYFTFFHSVMPVPINYSIGIGIYSYRRIVNDFFGTPYAGAVTVPLGGIVLPQNGKEVSRFGALNTSNETSATVFVAGDVSLNTTPESRKALIFNYISCLPISGGFRVVRHTAGTMASTTTLIDDGWSGMTVLKYSDGTVGTNAYALFDHLRLEIGTDQRVYFHQLSTTTTAVNHGASTMKVKLFYVPTYLTLAM
jgi:hypothetical protein